jgi:RNA polymerase sigma factor (sigma-70 family)
VKRKEVSSEEIKNALKIDDNIKVINGLKRKYAQVLDVDDFESAAMIGLWKTLGYHEEGRGQKFTSSLWLFVSWECRRLLRAKKANVKFVQMSSMGIDVPEKNGLDERCQKVKEYVELLSEKDKKVLKQYYYDNHTMEEIGNLNGYTKEAARQKINKGIKNLANFFKD